MKKHSQTLKLVNSVNKLVKGGVEKKKAVQYVASSFGLSASETSELERLAA